MFYDEGSIEAFILFMLMKCCKNTSCWSLQMKCIFPLLELAFVVVKVVVVAVAIALVVDKVVVVEVIRN